MFVIYGDFEGDEEIRNYYTKKGPLGLEREETLYDLIPYYFKENAIVDIINSADMAMIMNACTSIF